MQVKLRVRGGKHEGRELAISVPQFMIGRGEDAHLRPSSDLISRKHCCIKIQDSRVMVQDMGSRNGSFVNEEALEPNVEREVQSGDILRVGKLQFEFVVDIVKPNVKKPKVVGIADAVARSHGKSTDEDDLVDEESITDWLSEGTATGSSTISDTAQFRLDETPTKMFTKSSDLEAERKVTTDAEGESSTDESKSGRMKKKPGKLPPVPKQIAESSKGAADDVLRKFFNRR